MNRVVLKVGAALAAGCTMVLKPSEIAPLSSVVFAEMVHEAGFPPGVFNMVNGDGVGVGSILSSHPPLTLCHSLDQLAPAFLSARQLRMKTLARTWRQIANLVFDDCDLEKAVRSGAAFCFNNTGQSCNAATRMLVQRSIYDEAIEIASAGS